MDTNATKPKLLLADDSVTIRKVVEMTFAEENIEVFTANDGESAMLKFVETQPDIVLAHIKLPGTTGYQICEMIKQDETTRHIPVLLLVGSFEPFDEAEAKRVQADGFLTKPFASVRDLIARVRELLGHAHLPAAAGPETDDIENLYESSFAPTADIDEFETVDDFGDQQIDDEMIETLSPAPANVESRAAQVSAAATAEQSREFDWSPEAVITESEAGARQSPSAALEQTVAGESPDGNSATAAAIAPVEAPSEIEENASPATSRIAHSSDIGEPSTEFIALVAERVVEKLSDKVIREIAQDAVPRIAEKMMREALGQDKKE